MKYSSLLALLLMPLTLHAKDKVTLEWKFVSSQKPILGEQSHEGALNKPQGPEVLGISGVLSPENLRDVLKKAKRNSATLRSLPPCLVSSHQKSECKNIRSVSRYPRVVGDKRQFAVRKFEPDVEDQEIGYRLECTPVVQPDGVTLDLSMQLFFRVLEGYRETLLSGDLATTLTRNQSDLWSEKYPRVIDPVFKTRKVTTCVSLWSGQSLVIGAKNESSGYDYIILTATTRK